MKHCVYTHSIGGEIFYVGSGKLNRPYIKSRCAEWNDIVLSNNGKYDISIIYTGLSKIEATYVEEYVSKRRRLKGYNLVNKKDGDSIPYKVNVSLKTREKISNTLKGSNVKNETKIKISKSLKGRKFTDEHKSKISKSLKGNQNLATYSFLGKKHGDETKKRISTAISEINKKKYLFKPTGKIYTGLNISLQEMFLDISKMPEFKETKISKNTIKCWIRYCLGNNLNDQSRKMLKNKNIINKKYFIEVI